VFTVADTILWLSEDVDRNSATRKLRVVKVRGRSPMPGLHTCRITREGMQVFPRIPEQQRRRAARANKRLATGISGLDEMTGGGIPAGDVVLLTGPAGSGKTTFATHFIAQGLSDGESCVVAVFEEYPEAYLARAKTVSGDLDTMVERGRLAVTYLRPLDLSVDEMLGEIQSAVERVGATRVVIDSLSGFEVALAPTYRIDFRESLYRLVGALTATGVTVLMTDEVVDANPGARFTHERVSFITDDILVQRYVELDGRLEKVLSVVKMRGSDHATDFRVYRLTAEGAVIGESLSNYHGITTGVPQLAEPIIAVAADD
jgi:circadian clock protein KaiC